MVWNTRAKGLVLSVDDGNDLSRTEGLESRWAVVPLAN